MGKFTENIFKKLRACWMIKNEKKRNGRKRI